MAHKSIRVSKSKSFLGIVNAVFLKTLKNPEGFMKNIFLVAAVFLSASILSLSSAHANAEVIIEICNDAGVCVVPTPEVAAMYFAADALVKELNSPHPFGPTNDLMRALNEIDKCLKDGMGPSNDLRKLLEDTGIDNLLKNLGIQLFS
jgi:hypothetical protein